MLDAAPFGGKGMTPCLILTTIGRRSERSGRRRAEQQPAHEFALLLALELGEPLAQLPFSLKRAVRRA
jgi:hypothetical protein